MAAPPLRTLVGPVLALAAFLLQPAAASALPVEVVETSGMRIGDVGPIQGQFAPEIQRATGTPDTPRVGYYYHYAGLYYVDFWTSEGGYCIYHAKTYWKLTPEQAGDLLGISPDQLSKPWRYRVPAGLVFVIVIVGWGVWIDCSNRLSNRRRAVRFRTLVGDPRYQRAIQRLDEAAPEELALESRSSAPDASGSPMTASGDLLTLRVNHAVNCLAAEGIERTQAFQNLTFLMDELDDRARVQRVPGNG